MTFLSQTVMTGLDCQLSLGGVGMHSIFPGIKGTKKQIKRVQLIVKRKSLSEVNKGRCGHQEYPANMDVTILQQLMTPFGETDGVFSVHMAIIMT